MRKILFITLLFFASVTLRSQTCKFFTSDYDLGSSLITCLFQDSYGDIWIGTENGLNQYDGHEFRFYQKVPTDNSSLAHNFIRCITEDKDGHLLIGGYLGAQIFIRDEKCFSWNPFNNDDIVYSRSSIRDILTQEDGNILVSGSELFRLSIKDNRMVPSPPPMRLPASKTDRLFEDSAGNLWLFKNNDGVYKLDEHSQFLHYYSEVIYPTGICEVSDGGIYISSAHNGIFRFDESQDKLIHCDITGLEECYIQDIQSLGEDQVYICTNGRGVLTWKPGNKQSRSLSLQGLPFDSNKATVSCIMKDKTGNTWIGFYGKGLVMVPATANDFHQLSNHSSGLRIPLFSTTSALYISKDNHLWVGTSAEGIYSVDLRNNNVRHYIDNKSKDGATSQINCFCEDNDGRIWFGTMTRGLGLIDPKSGKCQYYQNAETVNCIALDDDGSLIIATRERGIFRFDVKTRKAEYIRALSEKVGTNVECLLKGDNGVLYVGSYDGAFGIIRTLEEEPRITLQYLSKCICYCIHQDGNDVFFGTSDGLVQLDYSTGLVNIYTKADGLPGDVINGIAGDNGHGIWISTNNGLSRFNKNSHQFENYFVGDGIAGNEFVKRAVCCGPNTELYFGGLNGITYFNADKIVKPSNHWTVKCTLTKEGRNTMHIQLSTAEYNAPEGIRFEYSLDGSPWELLASRVRNISFNSLNRGEHCFEVRVVDRDMRSTIRSYKFTIKPPLALSLWAIILYIAIFVCGISFYIKYYKLQVQAHEQLNQLKALMEISQNSSAPSIPIIPEIKDPNQASPDDKLMAKVMKVINENISNPDLSVDYISQEVGISRVHLYRKLKEITNLTSKDLVRYVRMSMAAEMLKRKKQSIAELSEAVGYNSPSAFSTAFKEYYGVSPSDYAKNGTTKRPVINKNKEESKQEG